MIPKIAQGPASTKVMSSMRGTEAKQGNLDQQKAANGVHNSCLSQICQQSTARLLQGNIYKLRP